MLHLSVRGIRVPLSAANAGRPRAPCRLGAADTSLHHLRPALPCRALAAPAALLMTVGQGAFRGLQDMRTPLAITLAANGINLALDTLLIVVLGWGVKGAATATTTAEWVAALAYLGVLYGRRDALGGLSPRLVMGASMQAAVAEMAPFLKAGGAMLMRTGLLLGTKTLASATAARWAVLVGSCRLSLSAPAACGVVDPAPLASAATAPWTGGQQRPAPLQRPDAAVPSPPVHCAGWAWCLWRHTKWSRSCGCCPRWWWIPWRLPGRAWWLCRCAAAGLLGRLLLPGGWAAVAVMCSAVAVRQGFVSAGR